MKRLYILLLIALLGMGLAVVGVLRSNPLVPANPPTVTPSHSPFPNFVAGAGIIEANTGNITVGTPVPGIVTEVFVKVGDQVKAGDALFKVDDRNLHAQLQTANAKIREAEANLAQSRHLLDFSKNLSRRNKSAVSVERLTELRDLVTVANTALDSAKAEAAQIEEQIRRHTIRAPVTGRLLQVKIRLGEYAQDGVTGTPLMVLGGNNRLYVRVDIDEYDAWRVRPDAKAVAFLRGNAAVKMALQFEYIEPYVIPKTALTGRSTERTDTRVLQVLYSFDQGELPVYVGEQVDVYIAAAPVLPQEPERTP